VFNIHKKLLCDSSSYFEAALNNGFAETLNQTIKLDDEEPAIIRTFFLWLYGGRLSLDMLRRDLWGDRVIEHMFKLYIFADKRGVINLANDTITMLTSYWSEAQVLLSETTWVVLHISRKSKLYELILDNLVLELRSEELDNDRLEAVDLSKEFWSDLLLRSNQLPEHFRGRNKCFQAVCHYHCHDVEGAISQEDCIHRIEAGYNIYYSTEAPEQVRWDGWR